MAAAPTRGVPDVSLDADPESGYEVVVGGTRETIGGTSASAPSWQGIWARAQGAHGGALGFAGPVLYGTEPATRSTTSRSAPTACTRQAPAMTWTRASARRTSPSWSAAP